MVHYISNGTSQKRKNETFLNGMEELLICNQTPKVIIKNSSDLYACRISWFSGAHWQASLNARAAMW